MGFFAFMASVDMPGRFADGGVKGDTGFALTPPFFRLMTAGFWPAAVDALWIRTLQGIERRDASSGGNAEFAAFYTLAQALDPYFYETYEQGSVFFAFLHEDPQEALRILDRGIRTFESGLAPPAFWTHPYTLYIFRGYVHAFLLNDFPAAREDYLKAASVPSAPAYLSSMKVWLAQAGGERKLALRVLKDLVERTEDPQVKRRYLEKLKNYGE